MSEYMKAVCLFVAMSATVVGACAWADDRPDSLTWTFRVVAPVCGATALGVIFWLVLRKDLMPDFLAGGTNNFANRHGLCFRSLAAEIDGVLHVCLYFQNQQLATCDAELALRPPPRYFPDAVSMPRVRVQFHCDPGAFGRILIPVPVPATLQGTEQELELGVTVRFPEGRGKRVRFRTGTVIRLNAQFRSVFRSILNAGYRLARFTFADIVEPVSVSFTVPGGVATELTEGDVNYVETLWRPGDDPADHLWLE